MLSGRPARSCPFLEVSHAAFHVFAPDGGNIIRLRLAVRNSAKVLVKVSKGNFRAYQLNPAPTGVLLARTRDGLEFKWPMLDKQVLDDKARFSLEPGETYTFAVDLKVPAGIEQVMLYSYFDNPRERNAGWRLESMYTLVEKASTPPPPVQTSAGVSRGKNEARE